MVLSDSIAIRIDEDDFIDLIQKKKCLIETCRNFKKSLDFMINTLYTMTLLEFSRVFCYILVI